MPEQDQSCGELKHREKGLGVPLISNERAAKVL
jgi:hypothetical protein